MISDYNLAIKNIQKKLNEYIIKNKLKSLILGVSGGIDSALCAALAFEVCENSGIKLIGRSITIETNKKDEIERSVNIGKLFCHDFKEVNLTESFHALKKNIFEDYTKEDINSHHYKIRQGNIKARLRMMYLYELASKNRGLVLSTDNYTELLLGFWTLHGDVGDYAMIQNLWKTEIYEMSKFLVNKYDDSNRQNALKTCIDAIPTDGLGISNSDLEQLQAADYHEVDKILIENYKYNKHINHPVIQRKINSEYKRNNPFNIARKDICKESLF